MIFPAKNKDPSWFSILGTLQRSNILPFLIKSEHDEIVAIITS